MEILRANQRRIAMAGGNHSALRMAVVPFRHSKLTEIFMDFFVGGGRAVSLAFFSFSGYILDVEGLIAETCSRL